MKLRRNHSKLSDEQLLHAFAKRNDSDAIGELWKRYSRLVYGLCLNMLKSKEDATDAVNGIFEKLLNAENNESVHSFKSWIYSVSKNHCLQILRKQQRRNLLMNDFIHTEVKPNASFESKVFEHEALKSALSDLSKEQRTCIRLFYYKEYSYQEISDETGWEKAQVKSHLQNGRRNLKIALNHLSYESN